jgi:hypothetical protein
MSRGYEGVLDRETILHGWIEGTRLGLKMYGEIRDFALDPEPMALSWMMDFDTVIYSFGDGRHAVEVVGLWAPSVEEYVTAWDEHETACEWEKSTLDPPWNLMVGYTAQDIPRHLDDGWMHQSEYIGGRMAEDILGTAGFYAAIYPSSADDSEPTEWAVAYISENIPGSA